MGVAPWVAGGGGRRVQHGGSGTVASPVRTSSRLRRVNRIVDALIPWILGFATVLTAGLASDPDGLMRPRRAVYETLLLVAIYEVAVLSGVAVAVVRRRRWPLYGVGLLAYLWLGFWVGPIIASYYTATSARRRAVAVGYCALATAAVGGRWIWKSTAKGENIVGGILFSAGLAALLVGLPFAVGAWVKARREVATYQAEQSSRLERERVAQVARARAEERTRIAREMHDVVAHRVTLMVLHAGALEVGATGPRRTWVWKRCRRRCSERRTGWCRRR